MAEENPATVRAAFGNTVVLNDAKLCLRNYLIKLNATEADDTVTQLQTGIDRLSDDLYVLK
jgi:hypothetical protein